MKQESEPIIKRFILKINSVGDTLETIDLQNITTKQRDEVLATVFTEALNRLGYSSTRSDAPAVPLT